MVATGGGFRLPAAGIEVTTSGSWALFLDRSRAAMTSRCGDRSMGAEKTRRAGVPQTSQAKTGGAVPSGRLMSNGPSRSQRYS